jgi:hypothetical protein
MASKKQKKKRGRETLCTGGQKLEELLNFPVHPSECSRSSRAKVRNCEISLFSMLLRASILSLKRGRAAFGNGGNGPIFVHESLGVRPPAQPGSTKAAT